VLRAGGHGCCDSGGQADHARGEQRVEASLARASVHLGPEESPDHAGTGRLRDDPDKDRLRVAHARTRAAFEQTNDVLHDQSTNGTYVRIDEDAETFLHSEKIVLRGHGVISLGRTIQHSAAHLIYFAAT
jgi:hypothetical protein